MKANDYVKLACVTEAPIGTEVSRRLIDSARALHGCTGLCTEVGELYDALKKHVFYGKEIDPVNVKEEIGDIMWYVAILCDHYQISLEEIMQKNIEKLQQRYGGKFTEFFANNRDLAKEYETLSQK
jgi:NTP pyrophosphatase (non-canonical NTP hydrolase)